MDTLSAVEKPLKVHKVDPPIRALAKAVLIQAAIDYSAKDSNFWERWQAKHFLCHRSRRHDLEYWLKLAGIDPDQRFNPTGLGNHSIARFASIWLPEWRASDLESETLW